MIFKSTTYPTLKGKISSVLTILLLMVFAPFAYAQKAKLMRFPATNGTSVVFSYGGNLYTADIEGGLARQLTQHKGYEMFPRFSEDGKQIAFTAQYDGNTEVYLIAANGGEPKRLTYTPTLSRDEIHDRMGPNNIVMGWENDKVIYRSRKSSFNPFIGHLYEVDSKGGMSEQWPLAVGSWFSLSNDKQKIACNHIFREFRTWKYYQGGMADDIFIHDRKSGAMENITNHVAQDIFPMWHEDIVYFLSDRDRTMNLFAYNTKTKTTEKITNFTDFDIKYPSIGQGKIVFEKGGLLYCYDIKKKQTKEIEIEISNDTGFRSEKWVDASKWLQGYELAPGGERLIVNARGDLFDLPAKDGVVYNLTQTSGVRERDVKWSPDGKKIAYISDKNGEDDIYIMEYPNGKTTQLTTIKSYKHGLVWSPDGKKIMWTDRNLRLQYIDIATKKITQVVKADAELITSYTWSPDSRLIVYTYPQWLAVSQLRAYDSETQKTHVLTDEWYDANSPRFSTDGKYLYFVSDREFKPTYGNTEWNHVYNNMSKIYIIPMQEGVRSPFEYTNDSLTISEEKKEVKTDKKKKQEEEKKIVWLLEKRSEQIIPIPTTAGQYSNLQVAKDKLYYFYKKQEEEKPTLKLYDFSSKTECTIGEFAGYKISSKHSHMVLMTADKKLGVVAVPSGDTKLKDLAPTNSMKMNLNLREEWEQIFKECHRQYTHFFYAPNMHNVDWDAIYKKYQPLVQHVQHRADLTYLIGEMIGELNVGHAYVGKGDIDEAERIQLGMLGAEIIRNKEGYYQIKKIRKGANWDASLRSPLTEANVEEGEYILSINRITCKGIDDIYKLLVDKANEVIEMEIAKNPQGEGKRKVLIKPIADESALEYYNWVNTNIEKVAKATNGEVGYIHIPDMITNGLNEFTKHFYPQLHKKALIIDDRGNGGGNVSQMIIERLRRELAMFNYTRDMRPGVNPYQMFTGPLILLVDQYSASDGDLFAYRFKKHELGKVIGRRTWGGVVGYRGTYTLIDGGYLVRPEFGHFDIEGKEWIIEGYGVEPDIEVYNNPYEEYKGNDEQLNKAIEEILLQLKEVKPHPSVPPFPDKSK